MQCKLQGEHSSLLTRSPVGGPTTAGVADQFLSDLRAASDEVRNQPATESGEPAIYGALESVEDTSNVNDLILGFIDSLTRVEDGS